ncbi:MAG: hypothetical protein FJW14_15235 [Acidimicrobiia bacterium]|nr:hypothetical protein [Acidimicrobiia bacterium]
MLIALALLLQSARPGVQDLSWLTGCWELTRGTRHVMEQWMRPEGGTLIGTSRTTADGKTLEYEFIVIREAAGGLEFVAKPSGQAEAIFRSTRIAAREVVFENPAHDFPTRITYRATGDGLHAAVEGDVSGQRRVIEFPYRACHAP